MTASELSRLVVGAREYRPGKYHAPCPRHGGKSGRSFAFEDADDGSKILATCRGGCRTADGMAVLGLGVADLYPGSPQRIDRATFRRSEEKKSLEAWRQIILTQVCVLLRGLDDQTERIDRYVEVFPGERDSDLVWERLGAVYEPYVTLERWFQLLNADDPGGHAVVYREMEAYRRVLDVA